MYWFSMGDRTALAVAAVRMLAEHGRRDPSRLDVLGASWRWTTATGSPGEVSRSDDFLELAASVGAEFGIRID